MSIQTDEAVILGTSPYSNTSLIATFFARKEGKIRVVARGARSPKSKIGVGLEPATRVQAEWSMAPGKDLGMLRYCETISVLSGLWSDIEAMQCAARILKTVDKIFGVHEGSEEHFDWTMAALEALGAGVDAGSLEALYISGLLTRLGIAPALGYCEACTKTPGSERAALDLEAGELRCGSCKLPAGQAIRLRAGAIPALGEGMKIGAEKIRSIKFYPSIQDEIIQAARALISFHVGVSLPARARQAK